LLLRWFSLNKSGWVIGKACLIVAIAVAFGWLARQRSTRDDVPPAAEPPAFAPPAQVPAAARAEAPPPAPPPSRPASLPAAAAASRDALAKIRDAVRRDPRRALTLIAADERAHPDGPLAEERRALKVDALVYADQIGEARDAADDYLRRYPHGSHAEHIEVLTGVHPTPTDSP
jgi:hypothetical protein